MSFYICSLHHIIHAPHTAVHCQLEKKKGKFSNHYKLLIDGKKEVTLQTIHELRTFPLIHLIHDILKVFFNVIKSRL